MSELKIDKKTGFKIITHPVIILDFRGIEFYDTSLYPNVKQFNLPPGEYTLDRGMIEPLKNSIDYPLQKTGKIERNRKWPTNFKIVLKNNPNKATIDWFFKEIEFDSNLVNTWSLPKLMFIYYHELGHARYNTESKVDSFAYNCMISEGYNPEQIGEAIITGLSEHQTERHQNGFEMTMKSLNYAST